MKQSAVIYLSPISLRKIYILFSIFVSPLTGCREGAQHFNF